MKAGDNDMGFVYLPHGGDHYTIAVFITDSMEDDKTNAAMGKIDKSHIVVSGFHACTVPVGAPGFMADNRFGR